LLFNILLSIFRLRPATKTTMAKTRVKSAMLEPKIVPSPIDGTPEMAEFMATKDSGIIEITATIKKPTT